MAARSSVDAGVRRLPQYRAARVGDLAACARVWRVSLAGYLEPLGLDDGIPLDLGPIQRLFEHLLRTDPDRWRAGYEELVAAGQVAAGHDPSVWFTNDYVPLR